MSDKKYLEIVAQVESYLQQHGPDHRGVGWFKGEQVGPRSEAMLGVIREPVGEPVTLLDFGCGAAHLCDYLRETGRAHIAYTGLDLSSAFLEISRAKYPQLSFLQMDVLDPDAVWPRFDYVVMNGIFTQRVSLSEVEMLAYMERLIGVVFAHARKGLAFNVMSKHVDWERDDLNHISFDQLSELLVRSVTRHFVVRHDYGLYEYTVYAYPEPARG